MICTQTASIFGNIFKERPVLWIGNYFKVERKYLISI
jgi:hypothetical protein